MEYDINFWKEFCSESGEQLAKLHGGSAGGWRKRIHKAKKQYPGLPWRFDPRHKRNTQQNTAPDSTLSPEEMYGTSVEVLTDGSLRIDTLLMLSIEQCKDPNYLLEAHGFDPKAWDLVSAKNNVFQGYSKRTISTYYCKVCKKAVDDSVCPDCGNLATKDVLSDGHDISTLYSSKITVKPKTTQFDIETIIEAMSTVRPVDITPKQLHGNGLLELSFMDAHFGVSTVDDYQKTLDAVDSLLDLGWERVIITVGSDLFHHDNLRGTTARGTVVEPMDFPSAWKDAGFFYSTIIERAVTIGADVVVIYVKGNHDESMAWAFCQWLAARYPQIEVDLAIEERKIHRYGNVCIGFTHGDKAVKDFDRIFNAEFVEFSSALIKEIHIGHTHHERVIDKHGVVTRTLPTRNKSDSWHTTEGYVGQNKRFQVFRYSTDELLGTDYV